MANGDIRPLGPCRGLVSEGLEGPLGARCGQELRNAGSKTSFPPLRPQFLFPSADSLEEGLEPFPRVGDVDLVEKRTVWPSAVCAVSARTRVDSDPNAGFHRGPSCLSKVIQEVSSPWQSDTP